MRLQGTVSNVTNFGAFVDIGVHQDGLVHISALADRFVKDPHEVVKAGDIVNVRVIEIDLERKRIALTMRSEEKDEERAGKNTKDGGQEQGSRNSNGKGGSQNKRSRMGKNGGGGQQRGNAGVVPETAFAQAFAKAQKKAEDRK